MMKDAQNLITKFYRQHISVIIKRIKDFLCKNLIFNPFLQPSKFYLKILFYGVKGGP